MKKLLKKKGLSRFIAFAVAMVLCVTSSPNTLKVAKASDTYDAGYDIVNNLDGVLEEFDRIIGLDRLCAIHINDSKNPFASHKDRHEKIGEGSIGIEAMRRIINHPSLRNLPFFLETPNDLDGYGKEIALLKSLYNE